MSFAAIPIPPLSPKKPHARESEEEFLYRLLDPRNALDVRLTDLSSKSLTLSLGTNKYRETAIRAWIHAQASPNPHPNRDGAGIVLVHPVHSRFLLTCKDDRHPIADFQNKLSILGGSMEAEETIEEGAIRELYEEVRDVRVADSIASAMKFFARFELEAYIAGEVHPYPFHVFVATAPTVAEFHRWEESLMVGQGLAEANPLALSITELQKLLAEEQAQPGRHFLAAHDKVFRALL